MGETFLLPYVLTHTAAPCFQGLLPAFCIALYIPGNPDNRYAKTRSVVYKKE